LEKHQNSVVRGGGPTTHTAVGKEKGQWEEGKKSAAYQLTSPWEKTALKQPKVGLDREREKLGPRVEILLGSGGSKSGREKKVTTTSCRSVENGRSFQEVRHSHPASEGRCLAAKRKKSKSQKHPAPEKKQGG